MNFKFPQIENGEKLYHYTSEEGLMGILQNQKIVLRLTKADSVNDITEGLDIYTHLDKVSKEFFENGKINSKQYNEILGLNHEEYSAWTISEVATNSENSLPAISINQRKSNAYIMCFSKDSDSLPMWNYYANYGHQGYCLRFNREYLSEYLSFTKNEISCDISDVIYSDEEKFKILRSEIDEIKSKDDFVERVYDIINRYKYVFKNSAFAYEKEVRLIISIPIDDEAIEIKFRSSSGHIFPYIEIEEEITDKNKMFFLINSVTLGPLAKKELANRNLKLYLEKMGYDIISMNVENSKIPVRF